MDLDDYLIGLLQMASELVSMFLFPSSVSILYPFLHFVLEVVFKTKYARQLLDFYAPLLIDSGSYR